MKSVPTQAALWLRQGLERGWSEGDLREVRTRMRTAHGDIDNSVRTMVLMGCIQQTSPELGADALWAEVHKALGGDSHQVPLTPAAGAAWAEGRSIR